MRRFDASWFAAGLFGLLAMTSLGCFGYGLLVARSATHAEILDTNHIALPADL